MSKEAAKAREGEAKNDQAVVEWRGHTFTMSRNYDEWTVDFLESIEEGKSVGIVRGALGPAQWRRVREMNLRVSDLAELSTLIAKAMGFGGSGESSPSSD